MNVEKFVEYTTSPNSAWNLVEGKVFNYVLERYFKDGFNWLNRSENLDIPGIITKYGSLIPRDFRALDLGMGTGQIARSLVEFGVQPENIVGLDRDSEVLKAFSVSENIHKICVDIKKFLPSLDKQLPNFGNFDLVTANMVFHLLNFRDYVRTLKQVRNVVTDRAQIYIMVPHPLREGMDSIPNYHNRKTLDEVSPWGDSVEYKSKTISDYVRGLHESGFNCWIIRTTGVDLELEDNRLLSDGAIWDRVQDIKKGRVIKPLPHYFRLWLMAFPV